MNLPPFKVNNVLLAYYPERILLGPKKTSPEIVQQVKNLWDQGYKSVEISKMLNITPIQVKIIFRDYFPSREGKRSYHNTEDINQIKNLWDSGKNSTEISEIMGMPIMVIHNILANHHADRERRGPGIKGTTRQDVDDMAELYRSGETLRTVADRFNLSHGVVRKHLTNRSDYDDLKHDNLINREKIRQPTQSSTKRMINKPHSKGISAIRRTGSPSGGSF